MNLISASNRRGDPGPFDIIGDVHGCLAELRELLTQLGYALDGSAPRPPAERRAIFLGDLVDRGPDSAGVLRLVMAMANAGAALALCGNHDDKLRRALHGNRVQLKAGLAETLAQLAAEPAGFRSEVQAFIAGLPSHIVCDAGRLVVAHAGLSEALQGRDSPAARSFALYGLTTGELDADGLPVRLEWARQYRGPALVIYGHTPVIAPLRLNHTLNIDTGCVFGGRLTAYRYPEDTLASVPAHQAYSTRKTPWTPASHT